MSKRIDRLLIHYNLKIYQMCFIEHRQIAPQDTVGNKILRHLKDNQSMPSGVQKIPPLR